MMSGQGEKDQMHQHYLAKARALSIPDACADAMARYLVYGVRPGSFLTAVLENRFVGAVGKADSHNALLLKNYARFLWNDIPSPAWGSPEKVKEWIERHGGDDELPY